MKVTVQLSLLKFQVIYQKQSFIMVTLTNNLLSSDGVKDLVQLIQLLKVIDFMEEEELMTDIPLMVQCYQSNLV
jgi:hypothetical protein